MKAGILLQAWLAAVMLFGSFLAAAQIAVPPLTTRVTDLTATLSGVQVNALEQKLAQLEARTGNQVAVLLVPSTQPDTIEQFAIRVFDQWKVGRKGVDDGVLLLVAKNDRKLRIEVGRGLEGVIPDAYAKRIIDEEITPRFRQGDFSGGIGAGVDRVIELVEGESMPPPQDRARAERTDDWTGWAFYGFIAVVIVGGILRSILGRFFGSVIIGAAAGAVAFTLGGVVIAIIIAVVAFLISLAGGTTMGRGSGWSSGGDWSSGGSGGFSGGGGTSGGGGASGSW